MNEPDTAESASLPEKSTGNSTPDQSGFTLGGVPLGSPIIKRALTLSVFEGSFCSVTLSLIETFSVAAAISLDAPSFVIGILGSLPLFLGSIGQYVLPTIISPTAGRRRIVVTGVLLQVFFLTLCAFSGFAGQTRAPYVFTISFILYGFSGTTVSSLWSGWMKDLTPSAVRGRHFAWRSRIFASIQLFSAIAVGVLSRKYTANNAPWSFYLAIFCVAASFRLVSAMLLSRQYEEKRRHRRPPLFDTAIPRQFLMYASASALLIGVTSLSGPFFNVWFLKDLHFDYLSLSIAAAATITGSIVSLPFWGRLTDRAGCFRIMSITAFLVAVIPLPYLFIQSRIAVWLCNFYSGIAWSGYNISNFNYLLESAGTENSDRRISVATALGGLSVFIFGLTGGFLASRLPVLFTYQLRTLFGLSSLLRLVVVILLFRRLMPLIREPVFSSGDLFNSLPGYRIGHGIMRASFRAFRRQ